MEARKFKTPYAPGDLACLPFEKKQEFMIQAEEAFIGWAFIVITREGVQGLHMVDQGPSSTEYKQASLEEPIHKRYSNISRSRKYAVDIFIRPDFINRSSVELDPNRKYFPFLKFLKHPNAHMVLANGHRRIRCVTQMLSDNKNKDVPWLAKFYDLGESHSATRPSIQS